MRLTAVRTVWVRRERAIPSVCEFDLERLDDQHLNELKFQSPVRPGRSLPKPGLPSAPALEILDPHSCARVSASSSSSPSTIASASAAEAASSPTESTYSADDAADLLVQCREVQSFCHTSMSSVFGLTGCGPVAVSYVNTMYVYPIHLEKFAYRNIAIRVQLLQHEVDFVCGMEDLEAHSAVLPAVYASDQSVVSAAYTLVNYHQKNPQFETEVKLCLPERLTLAHHVLFTFYHVHCKKLQPTQMQQELVGYAALPLLQRDGTLLADNHYVVNVFPAPITAKSASSTTGGVISLPPGYVAAARDMAPDSSKTTLAVRTRALSSIHSQDRSVAAFLQRFHGSPPLSPVSSSAAPVASSSATNDDIVVNKLLSLRLASTTNVRYFLFPIASFVLGYLRFGSPVVRWAAFRAFLAVVEKASWTPHRSLKQHDVNQILHSFVHIVFDEDAIAPPPGATASADTDAARPHAIFQALLMEWLLVLQDTSPVEDNIETKRLSLAYSNLLLQLVLKSMAMHASRTRTSALPRVLAPDDNALLESVLIELVRCIGTNTHGLLLQKEVNRSVASCCRGLFLIVRSAVPARVIAQYAQWIAANQCDANVLVHILFPFLRLLIDFEFFAVVNGARVLSAQRPRRSSLSSTSKTLDSVSPLRTTAWLAQIVLQRLVSVVDEQQEDKIRGDAARLLRRMFVAHVYNPLHQSSRDQETIALLYYPFFTTFAQFTADSKLLGGSSCDVLTSASSASNSDASDKSHELKKELLVCVVHLLSSVAIEHLALFFQQPGNLETESGAAQSMHESSSRDGDSRSRTTGDVPLSPTSALKQFRKIVQEVRLIQALALVALSLI